MARKKVRVRTQRIGPSRNDILANGIIRFQVSDPCSIVVFNDMCVNRLPVQLVVLQDAVEKLFSRRLVIKTIGPQTQDVRSADVDTAINQVLTDINFRECRNNLRVDV